MQKDSTVKRKIHIVYDYERGDKNMGIEDTVASFMIAMMIGIPFITFGITKVVDIRKNKRL